MIIRFLAKPLKNEWPEKASGLSIGFHVHDETGKIWGAFKIGIFEGILLFKNSPKSFELGVSQQFKWRGEEAGTSDRMSGKGTMTCKGGQRVQEVQGVFHDMWGDVVFAGKRKAMPRSTSGAGSWFYCASWKEHGRTL